MSPSPQLRRLLNGLADFIAAIHKPHPLRVAIDGVDAAGKTILAEELDPLIEQRGRPTIRASIDGFHRPRADRYRMGHDSPEGYYMDSFDNDLLLKSLLEPLGPDGNRRIRRRGFDYRFDSVVEEEIEEAPGNAVLLFDGVFLFRPELNDAWDFRIFVDADFDVTLRRSMSRDQELFGSAEETKIRYEQRYIPGQRIYLEKVDPKSLADVVINNNDPTHPLLESEIPPL